MLGLIEPFTWLCRMPRAGQRTSTRGSSPNSSPRFGVSKSSSITKPAIVQKASGDLAKALVDPALVDKLARNAYTAESSSPDELAKFLKADTEKWEAVLKTTGIKID